MWSDVACSFLHFINQPTPKSSPFVFALRSVSSARCISFMTFNLAALQHTLETRERLTLEIPEFRRAAVLVGVQLEPEPTLVLTQRSSDLPTHQGQIAFPGGSLEPNETVINAALREALEEIALESAMVQVLGLLNDVWTPAGFHVTPVVAVISSEAVLQSDPREVQRLLFVPLRELGEIQPVFENKILPNEARVPSFETRTRAVPHYIWRGVDIWGMTAFVIGDLLELLRENSS
jgi:8-oxo-dGTP pyrophosphatase MutT (NUDIX family)